MKSLDLKERTTNKTSVDSSTRVRLWNHRGIRDSLKINSSKKVWKLEFHRSYFSYYHTSNIVFDIIRKPVYLSLNWYHINGYEIMESTLQLVLIESQKWNLAKHCVLAIVGSRWRMKTIGVSLLGNANELHDLISDLHSYPAAFYIQ